MTTPMSCSISTTVTPGQLVDVEDVAGHVLLLLGVHAGHRLVEQEDAGLQAERAAELDALLEAVGEPTDFVLAGPPGARGSR